LYLFTGRDIYHSHDRTELVYSLSSLPELKSDDFKNMSSNLTEGIFKNNNCISSRESEKNRFNLFIELLNIQPGENVLDCGCGNGGLVLYLRKKKINAEGITICKTQYVNNLEKYGNFHYGDYTVLQPQFVNKFDHIILPGSLEHPFGGNPLHLSSTKYKSQKMTQMFMMMQKYFNENSPSKQILITCIHVNEKVMDKYKLEAWITERMFGGLYPNINKYSVAESLTDANYTVIFNKDYSWHYYYASFCDINHFGNPINIGIWTTLLLSIFYPHMVYAYIYWKYGLWMHMWSGKYHTRRIQKICNPQKECDLSFEPDINKRPCTLYYTVAKAY